MSEEIVPGTWGRLILALRQYRPVAWLVFLTASLVLFHAWMPAQMRMISRNLSIVGAYFPWNVRTSFPGKSGRNPDIWIPGSRSTGSEREMNSYDPV